MPVHIRVPDWRTLHVAYGDDWLMGWRTRAAAEQHINDLAGAGRRPEHPRTAATLVVERCKCEGAA